MALGLTMRYFFIRIFIVGISKFCGGNETYPWLDDDLKYMLKNFVGNSSSQFRENRDWKSPKSPIDLTLAKNYFVKTRKIDFSRGGDLAYRIDHPPKTYSEKFSAKFNAAFRSVARSRNLRPPLKIRPDETAQVDFS